MMGSYDGAIFRNSDLVLVSWIFYCTTLIVPLAEMDNHTIIFFFFFFLLENVFSSELPH